MKFKTPLLLLLSLIVVIFGYVKYTDLQPVNIVSVHQDGAYIDILVKNFPLTDKGRITWWLKNKDSLKDTYNLPITVKGDGFYFITIWNFGDGYVEDDGYDRLCFDDMREKKHCINKEPFLTIRKGKETGLTFLIDDDKYKVDAEGNLMNF